MNARSFSEEVHEKIARRRRRRRDDDHWYWVGLFGMVGWSVMVPTILGIALGVLLDETREDPVSWTLTGLFVGLVAGVATASYWVRQESRRE